MVQKNKKSKKLAPSLSAKKTAYIPSLSVSPSPLPHPVYTTAQVAAALQLSSKTILRAIEKGQLEARKTGKLYLISQDAVQRFWESLPLATAAPKTVGRPKKPRHPEAAAE
jgi:excisionase family DNA binding protein